LRRTLVHYNIIQQGYSVFNNKKTFLRTELHKSDMYISPLRSSKQFV